MRIAVLGPLEVTRDQQSLRLPQSKKARALLAYLAVTGRPRTRNQLCDMFWDVADDPRAGLRWCLSRLRSVINADGAEVLVTDRRSVGLAMDQVATDLVDITERLGAGDDLGIAELKAMAEQFRGPLLEGLEFPDLHAVQAWLIAQRSEARQLHAEVLDRLLARLSDPDEAIPYARALVQAAPHVEAWHVKHVQLLVAAGRTVEADEQYQAGMRELEAQGVGTHALRRAWRRASSGPAEQPGDAELLAPLSGSPFVGRSAELATLQGLVERAIDGRGGIVTIAGEPGIGKSRLIHEAARRANGAGVTVLEGSCANTGYAIPYLPFIEALDRPAADLPADRIADQVPLLARILPELAERHGIDVDPAAVDHQDRDRYALFRAVAALLGELAEDRGLLLLLEDVHWADTQSLLMISYLARMLGESRVLLVATYRDIEVSRKHPLSDALVALRRGADYTRLALKRLEGDAAAELIGELSGAEPAIVQAIFQQTEGHPLFIEEVVKHLLEEGRVGEAISTGSQLLASLGLPEGVRDVIGRRLSRLSEPCNRMLACASAMTGVIPWPVLVQVCGGDEDELLDQLDEALAAQVVRERPGIRAGSYEFTHALIQQALYDELTTSRRLRLHRRIGDAIERVFDAQLEPHLVELAHHYYEAAAAGDLDKFLHYTLGAGERATQLMAFEEAAQLYERALGTLDELDAGPVGVRGRLHELYGRALATMNRWSEARVQFERALVGVTDDDHRARLLLDAAICEFWMLDTDNVRALASQALALEGTAGDPRLTAAATGYLAQADMSDGEVAAGGAHYRRAHTLAGDLSDRQVAQALQQYPISLYWAGRFDEALATGRELIATARSHSDGAMVMNLLAVMAMSMGCAGRYRESTALFREAEQFGRDHGIGTLLARTACMQVGWTADLGALDYAQERADAALEAASRAGFAPSVVSTQLDQLLLAIARDQVGTAEALLPGVEHSVANAAGFHGWIWSMRIALARAQLALARGDSEAAAAGARSLVAEAGRTGRVKYVVAAHRVLADAQLAADQRDQAVATLQSAAAAARSIRYPALVIQVAGDLLALADDAALAAEANRAVDEIGQQIDDPRILAALGESPAIARIRQAAV